MPSSELARQLREAQAQLGKANEELARTRAALADREEALERATHAAEAANEARERFLSSVSHELRTPLSAILLWSSLIDEQQVTDPQLAEALESIKRSAEEQRALIDDIVDTSRLLSGKLRLDLQEIDVTAVVHAGIVSAMPAAEHKRVELREVSQLAPEIVRADSRRLQQIVSHLVLNAVKFTPAKGRVTVELRRAGRDLQIVVRDTGLGIAPDKLAGIFERHGAIDGKCARTECGLGLGLLITHKIVSLHGGAISAESPGPGHGATFTVSLPLAAVRPESAAGSAGGALAGLLEACRILLIEAPDHSRESLASVLQEAGAEIEAFDSTAAAWSAFSRHRPDVVVSELRLEGIDGGEFIRRVRAAEEAEEAPAVPALAIAADASHHSVEQALESGFQTCLSRPVDPLRLAATIATLIGTRSPR